MIIPTHLQASRCGGTKTPQAKRFKSKLCQRAGEQPARDNLMADEKVKRKGF